MKYHMKSKPLQTRNSIKLSDKKNNNIWDNYTVNFKTILWIWSGGSGGQICLIQINTSVVPLIVSRQWQTSHNSVAQRAQ